MTENIENLSASRQNLRLRTTVSTVWSAASIPESEAQAIQSRLPDTMYVTQAMAPTSVRTVHHTSLLHIESNLDRLGLNDYDLNSF